jgi:hypothetical protein
MRTVIKENEGFRLSLNKNLCTMPNDLYHIEMTQEQLKDREVSQSSTYQFFMTQQEIETLAEAILK